MTDGGWRMADGGWRMADGGWRMADGGWRMADGGWRMADGGWRMADGKWRMANGGWQMADGRMVDGRWQMADGKWQMTDRGRAFSGRRWVRDLEKSANEAKSEMTQMHKAPGFDSENGEPARRERTQIDGVRRGPGALVNDRQVTIVPAERGRGVPHADRVVPGSHNFLFWINLKSKTGQRGLFSEACNLNKSRHFTCRPYSG